MNNAFGVTHVDILTPSEIKELYPLLKTDDLLGGSWVPQDGQASPVDVTAAYVKGAAAIPAPSRRTRRGQRRVRQQRHGHQETADQAVFGNEPDAKLDRFVTSVSGSSHTDISGGMLQAAEWLNETGAGHKHILVFSDLEEDLREGYVRDFEIDRFIVRAVSHVDTIARADDIRRLLDRLPRRTR